MMHLAKKSDVPGRVFVHDRILFDVVVVKNWCTAEDTTKEALLSNLAFDGFGYRWTVCHWRLELGGGAPPGTAQHRTLLPKRLATAKASGMSALGPLPKASRRLLPNPMQIAAKGRGARHDLRARAQEKPRANRKFCKISPTS